MTEHILKMVKTPNPQAIQRYVKNHLPNDPISLERIYKELLTYQFQPQPEKISKEVKKSLSVKSFKSRQSLSRNKPRQDRDQVKKTQNLIKMLRQKGLKAEGDCQEAGIALFTTHRQRLVKPLLTNSKLLKSQTAHIDRVINRYRINNQFYGQGIKKEGTIDPQMEEFFKRRQSVLESIKNQNNAVSLNRKFSYVEPKLYRTASMRQSFQKMPTTQVPLNIESHLSSAQALMSICQQELSLQKFKEIHPKMNIFRGLQMIPKDEQQEDPELQDSQNLKKKIADQQYQRYTNSYMEMMNKKTKVGNKCRLSKYDKDLLRDAKKMRRIIDFDNK